MKNTIAKRCGEHRYLISYTDGNEDFARAAVLGLIERGDIDMRDAECLLDQIDLNESVTEGDFNARFKLA